MYLSSYQLPLVIIRHASPRQNIRSMSGFRTYRSFPSVIIQHGRNNLYIPTRYLISTALQIYHGVPNSSQLSHLLPVGSVVPTPLSRVSKPKIQTQELCLKTNPPSLYTPAICMKPQHSSNKKAKQVFDKAPLSTKYYYVF